MKAVIMAGGEGSRLRPITCSMPKPMIPVINIPVMEHIINLLKQHNITEIAVTLMYLPQIIKDYFRDGTEFGVKLHYFTEKTPLGTAGSVKNAESFLDKTFVVISGDSLTDANITKAVDFHKEKNSLATLILSRVDVPLEYGVVITDEDSNIKGFLEKPRWGEVFSDTVNTGIYILEPEILKSMKAGESCDFSHDIFPKLLSEKKQLSGYVTDGYWSDIGDIKSYLQTHSDIMNKNTSIKARVQEIEKGIWIAGDAQVHKDAVIQAPCVIGSNCRIGSGSVIGKYCVLGDNTVVEDKVTIKRSIIMNNAYIETGCELRGSIICSGAILKNNVSVFENAVVGQNSLINEHVVIKPNTMVWPHKNVDPMSVVDRNIVWGSRYSGTIFGVKGLSGIINVDISPEYATRLGAAYGSMFDKGARVVVSSTTSNPARMFKHAFISGILSVGIEVFNLSSLLTPISRHAVSFLSAAGGIHIKLGGNNPDKLQVDFMDEKGAGISHVMQRKIENAFFREDFKRSSGGEISRLNNITDFSNYYVRATLNDVDVSAIRAKSPKINVFSPSDYVISLIVPMLQDAGCKVVSFSSSSLEKHGAILKSITESNADFAAFIDSNGESLTLIAKTGRIITGDIFLVLTSLILFIGSPETEVVIPVTAPSVIEILAGKYNGKVVRTKASQQAIMEQMLSYDLLKNRCGQDTTQFLLNFDALAGLVKITEFLCRHDRKLEDLVDEIPEFYISRQDVFCPWEQKGLVMRTLINEKGNGRAELLDGVKYMFEKGWALILPHSSQPLFKVYAEGPSQKDAQNIAESYAEKIRKILSPGDSHSS